MASGFRITLLGYAQSPIDYNEELLGERAANLSGVAFPHGMLDPFVQRLLHLDSGESLNGWNASLHMTSL
jgi:hypothetical protein